MDVDDFLPDIIPCDPIENLKSKKLFINFLTQTHRSFLFLVALLGTKLRDYLN